VNVARQLSHARWSVPLAVAGASLAVAATAVSASQRPADRRPDAGKQHVAATLREFAVRPAHHTVAAGQVTFVVHNAGHRVHEMVILRTDADPDDLPRHGGRAKEAGKVDEVENVRPGSTKVLTVHLKPGRYVLICNIAGHYAAGMHAALRVT
jgi:uncharacterized cupredoxin-like copper-binding protein